MTQDSESPTLARDAGGNVSGNPDLMSLSIRANPGQITSLPGDESFWRTAEVVGIFKDVRKAMSSSERSANVGEKLQENVAALLVNNFQDKLGVRSAV
jgi:hypothetical protein